MSALACAAAGTALALPRRLTASLLPRALGLYVAGSAGTIQLLDILVDRLALDDRVFAFAILLAVIGIPFAAAGALLADAGRGERRRPVPRRGDGAGDYTARFVTRAHVAAGGAGEDAVDARRGSSAQHAESGARAPADAVPAQLTRRLEISLSYRRIAELHASAGDADAAAVHRDAWRREAITLADELRRLASASDGSDDGESADVQSGA